MSNLKMSAFVGIGNNSIEYDYPLEPLIEEFDKDGFYALFDSPNAVNKDNGAYLVITGKQYILSLNYKYGKGTHMLAAARIYNEISGRNLDRNNVTNLAFELEKASSVIHSRIYYEYQRDNDYGVGIYSGAIVFPLNDKKFNTMTTEMFLKFYEDYAQQIKSSCLKYNFKVFFSYYNDNGELVTDESDDLENLKAYILNNQDDMIKDYFEEKGISEKIIGTTKKENTFRR